MTKVISSVTIGRRWRLAEPVFARLVRRDLAACCERLKVLLEANADRNDLRTQAA